MKATTKKEEEKKAANETNSFIPIYRMLCSLTLSFIFKLDVVNNGNSDECDSESDDILYW